MESSIYFVTLRSPGKNDPRMDPFWEFGSFGCTGCHSKNLLNPKHCPIKAGDRLAFVQGGSGGMRLMLLTPPITQVKPTLNGTMEVKWDRTARPFKYASAPPLFRTNSPRERSLFEQLQQTISAVKRSTWDAKFASAYRSRTKPLEDPIAKEVERLFKKFRRPAAASDLMGHYGDTFPGGAPVIIRERQAEYQRLTREEKVKDRCGKRRCGTQRENRKIVRGKC